MRGVVGALSREFPQVVFISIDAASPQGRFGVKSASLERFGLVVHDRAARIAWAASGHDMTRQQVVAGLREALKR